MTKKLKKGADYRIDDEGTTILHFEPTTDQSVRPDGKGGWEVVQPGVDVQAPSFGVHHNGSKSMGRGTKRPSRRQPPPE